MFDVTATIHSHTQDAEFSIVESRCKVCSSPTRRDIDIMLVTGWSQAYIRGLFNAFIGEAYFTANNISRHERRHVNPNDPPLRRFFQRSIERARERGWMDAAHSPSPKTVREALEVIRQVGGVAIHAGLVVVEPHDLLKAIKLLDELDSREANVDEVKREFNLFVQAARKVVPATVWEGLVDEFERLLEASEPQRIPWVKRAEILAPRTS